MPDKPLCQHYLRWRDAPEPLQMEECYWLETDVHNKWLPICDYGQNHEGFQKKCKDAWRWGH